MPPASNAAKFYVFFAESIREADAERGGWEKNPLTSRAQVFDALEMAWRRMREGERKVFERENRHPEAFKRPLARAL